MSKSGADTRYLTLSYQELTTIAGAITTFAYVPFCTLPKHSYSSAMANNLQRLFDEIIEIRNRHPIGGSQFPLVHQCFPVEDCQTMLDCLEWAIQACDGHPVDLNCHLSVNREEEALAVIQKLRDVLN